MHGPYPFYELQGVSHRIPEEASLTLTRLIIEPLNEHE